MNNSIVIFGSVLTSEAPNDIDVAYNGDISIEEVDVIVKNWAARKGLPNTLRLDLHRCKGNAINLPAPFGVRQSYEVIYGETQVVFKNVETLAAAIRLYGSTDVEKTREYIYKVINSNTGAEIGIANEQEQGWDQYVMGLNALQSAIKKANLWLSVKENLGELGDFLEKLVNKGVTENAKLYFNSHSSGESAIMLLKLNKEAILSGYAKVIVTSQYGAKEYSLTDTEKMFLQI